MRAALRLATLIAALGCALFTSCALRPAFAQTLIGWDTRTILAADTISTGTYRQSSLVDMSGYRYATLTVKVNPPAGAATPWAKVSLYLIGSSNAFPDTNSTSILQLQPTANESYLGSAAGDSLAYGAFWQGSAVQVGPGEIKVLGQNPSTKVSLPASFTFDLNNKGQSVSTRYFYVIARVLSAGGSGPTRVTLKVTRRN